MPCKNSSMVSRFKRYWLSSQEADSSYISTGHPSVSAEPRARKRISALGESVPDPSASSWIFRAMLPDISAWIPDPAASLQSPETISMSSPWIMNSIRSRLPMTFEFTLL